MLWFALAAIVSFHLAYAVKHCQVLIVVFLYCLIRLAALLTLRVAFYLGIAIGMAIYAPHLAFFWTLFQGGAIALWLILSCWLGAFLLIGAACFQKFGPIGWACAAPFVWTGLEYFRSELYYLKFSWLNVGYVFSDTAALHYLAGCGVYGIGFALMAVSAYANVFRQLNSRLRILAAGAIALLLLYPLIAPTGQPATGQSFRVTGVQLEVPGPAEVVEGLNHAIKKFPDTSLFVLSECSFTGPVPDLVKNWCRKHQKYLAGGGEDPVSATQYYNTVFVVSPAGEIVFRQAKCVPVQFMKDGLPAATQQVWNSPWGKLGFGICYDASYTRVTDALVRQGAQGLIFPTMDTVDWNNYEHHLHARIAPMRAAEYALPVFRLCSSGISQYVEPTGRVLESAPYPGQGAIMSAQMQLRSEGRMPPDRWLAVTSVAITLALTGWLYIGPVRRQATNFKALTG
jgi:apolipoprotein N-acyltransferase